MLKTTSKMLVLLVALAFSSTTSAKRTSTKTHVDIRVVRSPQHHTEQTSSYVLASHAGSEEGQSAEEHPEQHHHQQVSVVSEAHYEALLKQAQKALKGYDLTKLSAAAHQAVQQVEHKMPKVLYKPEVKYVYSHVPTAPAHNTASATYHASYTSEQEHQVDTHDHYSKHKFGYRVHDPHSGAAFGHSEVSEGKVTKGHYHVLLPDGRLQTVKYVADPSGYHATVTYEKYY